MSGTPAFLTNVATVLLPALAAFAIFWRRGKVASRTVGAVFALLAALAGGKLLANIDGMRQLHRLSPDQIATVTFDTSALSGPTSLERVGDALHETRWSFPLKQTYGREKDLTVTDRTGAAHHLTVARDLAGRGAFITVHLRHRWLLSSEGDVYSGDLPRALSSGGVRF